MRPIHLVRWGIPLALAAVGTAILVATDVEGVGEALIAAGICVVVANLMLRVAFSDQRDRDREERARRYFDEHGHWPGEGPRR
ncbi:MAG: hypothetical protein IRZ32_13685 [Solirubrobacteraceae bacterium]|nr:hypothetical protein [Solirubrobacteraceae bacterium]